MIDNQMPHCYSLIFTDMSDQVDQEIIDQVDQGLVGIIAAVMSFTVTMCLILLSLLSIIVARHYCRMRRAHRSTSIALDNSAGNRGPGCPACPEHDSGHIPPIKGDPPPRIALVHCLSRGHFSQVYFGMYNDQIAAVKVYRLQQETHWLAEMKIYSRAEFAHDGVLRLIAGEACAIDGQTNLCLTTQYHPNGCLSLFLDQTTLSLATMLRMGASIAGGLAHLHSESLEAGRSKPALVHCNISSDNVLVKDDLTCCIADFKLAIIKDYNSINVSLPESRILYGTARYSAPELLRGEIGHQMCPFQSLKQADVYALGLVLWELCIRCNAIDGEQLAQFVNRTLN